MQAPEVMSGEGATPASGALLDWRCRTCLKRGNCAHWAGRLYRSSCGLLQGQQCTCAACSGYNLPGPDPARPLHHPVQTCTALAS